MITLLSHPPLRRAVLAGALAGLSMPTWAHGDEDHSHDGQPPAPPAAMTPDAGGPRAAAQTELFELVAVMTPRPANQPQARPQLMIYLDRFDTNAPVAGANIEIESGAFKGTATQQSPGVYTLDAAPLAQAGRHLLNVTVDAADTSDLMSLTLETGAGHDDEHGAPGTGSPSADAPWWSRHAWLTGALAVAAVAAIAAGIARLRKGRT